MSNVDENIPNDWVETTLGAIMEISSGKTRPKVEGEIPIYGGNGIMGYGNKSNQEQPSIIVGRVGAYCGAVYLEKKPFWLSDNALGVRNNLDSDLMFLYYKLISMRLNNHAIGGAQPLVTQTLLKELEILIPKEIEEQKAIANILTAFDDKIENLQAQNKTLEQTAQTIFKEWFGKYQVGDELPDGWRVGKLSEIAKFLNGLALQKYPPIAGEETLPVIKIRELKQGITSNTDKANTHLDKKYIIQNGDVLFSWSGSLEIVIWQNGKGALNQHLFKVSSEEFPKWFYYFWILHHLREFKGVAANKATTMGHINRKHLDLAEVVIPDEVSLIKHNQIFHPLIEKLENNHQQIQTLKQTRDTLLPKLMSGALRVNAFKA